MIPGMVLAPLLLALVAQGPGEGCLRCDHRGVVPCEEHSEEWRDMESRVEYCSVAAACEACGGTMLVDCKYCKEGPESRPNEERRRLIQAWLKTTSLEEYVGRPLPRVETEHHRLVVDTGVVRDGSKKVDEHTLIHLIADDVEHVARSIGEHYRVEPRDYSSKMRMWIWKDPADHARAMERFLHSRSTGDFKMLGRAPVFSVSIEPPNFDSVSEIRSVFAHNSAHMLISNLVRPLWFGDLGGGWLDAGAGHWYEYEIFGRSTNFCIEEATLVEDYENGQWRAPIRRRLAKEEEPFLPRLVGMSTAAMTQSEQALCWSFYDFLVAEHADALRPILEDLKQKKEARDVFPERLGMGVLEAEAAWREWVAATYPTRGDKPRGSGSKGTR